MSEQTENKPQEGQSSYLSTAASYVPGLGGGSSNDSGDSTSKSATESVTDGAKSAGGAAQKGLHTGGTTLRDNTSSLPIVGGVTEGVGNMPITQKLGGAEEEKGYLSQAYEYAGEKARTVYDAAGNAIGTVREKAGSYVSSSNKDSSDPSEAQPAPADDGQQKVLNQATGAAKDADAKAGGPSETVSSGASAATDTAKDAGSSVTGAVSGLTGSESKPTPDNAPNPDAAGEAQEKTEEGAEKSKMTAAEAKQQGERKAGEAQDKTEEAKEKTETSASDTASTAQQKYSETTEAAKSAHRDVEDKAQSGIKDTVSSAQDATGTKDATGDASEGLDQTADAAKGTARKAEDQVTETVGGVGGGVSKAGEGEYSQGAKDAAGSVGSGAKGAVTGAGEGVKDVGGGVASTGSGVAKGVGSGLGSAGGALGLGGGKEE